MICSLNLVLVLRTWRISHRKGAMGSLEKWEDSPHWVRYPMSVSGGVCKFCLDFPLTLYTTILDLIHSCTELALTGPSAIPDLKFHKL